MIFRARTWASFVRCRPGLVQLTKLNLWPCGVLRGTGKRSDRCRRFTVPVPITVVAASVSPTYAGQRVEIAFTVDANGTVSGFSVKSSPDAAMAERVMDAVRRWKFQPAVSGGVAVATKVVLPVTITEDRFVGAPFAARSGINKPSNQPRAHLKAGALW